MHLCTRLVHGVSVTLTFILFSLSNIYYFTKKRAFMERIKVLHVLVNNNCVVKVLGQLYIIRAGKVYYLFLF